MRFAYFGWGLLLLASGLACRRHPLAGSERGDSGPPVIDASVVDIGADHGAGGDAADASDMSDSPVPRDAADPSDGPIQPLACGALRVLAAAGPFTSRHAHEVLFSPDRRLLVVQAAGPPDDLMLVPLPDGVPRMLLGGVKDAEWLGASGKVLATLASSGDLVVVSLDGAAPRTIAHGTCFHLAVPDGSRVFALRDCRRTTIPTDGALDEIALDSGTVVPRAPTATSELAVSPSGRFAAFVEPDRDAGVGRGVLHVLDGDRDQPLAAQPATTPAFASDQRLLFEVSGSDYAFADAYVHVPGSGAGSQRVAEARSFGLRGYRIAPDGSLVLAAYWPKSSPPWNTSLVAVRLDGGGEQEIAGDLFPYYATEIALNPFTFSADGRLILFMAARNTTALGVFAIPAAGGERRSLAPGGAFAVSQFADRVAIIDAPATSRAQTIHVVAAASGVEALAFQSDTTVGGLSFVPGDRGLLYIDRATPTQLSHLSFVDGRRTLVGSWSRSQLPLGDPPQGEMTTGYPVDPTGCFTLIDDETTGTSLVVLPDAPE